MRYPLQGLIPDNEPCRYTDKGVMETGSSSSGTGYTARAIVERRVTSNWFVGLGVDIQEAKDYTPSHALLYVRYSAAGWQVIWTYHRNRWCLMQTGDRIFT